MVFVEEPMSYMERYVGRRIVLATLVISLIAYLGTSVNADIASFIGGGFMIIMHSYFGDITDEKQATMKVKKGE